ncbi:MAG: hypothetical protein ACRDL3_05170 [Solirubrobacterales bacterium]
MDPRPELARYGLELVTVRYFPIGSLCALARARRVAARDADRHGTRTVMHGQGGGEGSRLRASRDPDDVGLWGVERCHPVGEAIA